jgi:NAD(P)-dependent dehydrogenase (short-subunit alcohol dehydrogenase family)
VGASVLREKTILITGASRGIGLALTKVCLGEKLKVVGLCRQAGDALFQLQESFAGQLKVYTTDLSYLAETEQALKKVWDENPDISIVVNNAGVYSEQRIETAEKIEQTVAVNVLAPLLISRMFLLRRQNRGGQILNVTSVGEKYGVEKWDDVQSVNSYAGNPVYNFSKLWITLVTYYLANHSPGFQINCIHPGPTKTNLIGSADIERMPLLLKILFSCVARFRQSPEEAAAAILKVIKHVEERSVSNSYFSKASLGNSSRVSRDIDRQANAFSQAETILNNLVGVPCSQGGATEKPIK